MPANSDRQSTIPEITPEELRNPDQLAAKLNNVLQFLASQVASVQGSSGSSTFKVPVTATSFTATDTSVPTDPGQVLTKAAADALYAKK